MILLAFGQCHKTSGYTTTLLLSQCYECQMPYDEWSHTTGQAYASHHSNFTHTAVVHALIVTANTAIVVVVVVRVVTGRKNGYCTNKN